MKNTRLKMQIMKCRLTNCPNEIKKFIKNLFKEKKNKNESTLTCTHR